MRKIIRRKKGNSKFRMIIYNHIKNNQKDYIIAVLLFLIGIIIGIMFINHATETQFLEISNYIKTMANTIKSAENIDFSTLLKDSVFSNFVSVLILWIAASTIIGIPIVYGIIIFRGFVLGYTISSIIASIGIGNGILFSLSSLLLHNIIFIPVILAIAVSGMKLYQSIIKNREKENVKIEFMRHTIFCVIMLCFLGIASFVETYISTNLVKFVLNYIKI